MNNEPVAYINEKDGLVCAKCYKPFKTLTDEEIWHEWKIYYPDVFHTHLIEFARAILRKAQEK
jgi:hypothetical protein